MRLLNFTFQLNLPSRDIAGFRAALAKAAGFEQEVFHNHEQDSGKLHYRYPLVQYRSERGSAGIIGIDSGADAILNWYTHNDGTFLYNGTEHKLQLGKMDVRNYEIEYHESPRKYALRQWLPLNQKRYDDWKKMDAMSDRIQELERILAANILTFCRAVNWRLPQKFNATVCEITKTYKTGFLGNPHIAFDVVFSTDLRLPHGIGLGKAVSHGFGVCIPYKPPRARIQAKASNDVAE